MTKDPEKREWRSTHRTQLLTKPSRRWLAAAQAPARVSPVTPPPREQREPAPASASPGEGPPQRSGLKVSSSAARADAEAEEAPRAGEGC